MIGSQAEADRSDELVCRQVARSITTDSLKPRAGHGFVPELGDAADVIPELSRREVTGNFVFARVRGTRAPRLGASARLRPLVATTVSHEGQRRPRATCDSRPEHLCLARGSAVQRLAVMPRLVQENISSRAKRFPKAARGRGERSARQEGGAHVPPRSACSLAPLSAHAHVMFSERAHSPRRFLGNMTPSGSMFLCSVAGKARGSTRS